MSDDLPRPPDWDEPVRIPDVELRVRRILVPFDGSHTAEQALAYAAALAHRQDAEVVVVVAFDPPVTLRRRAGLVVEDRRRAMEAEARELAEESVTLLRARGVTARGIVARGEIVAAILQCIEDEQADLVILGRRGLTAEIRAAHPVLGVLRATDSGSVADKVARHATAPVLLVG